jgi:glycosyltransferase involved in cell wall biosynthesis
MNVLQQSSMKSKLVQEADVRKSVQRANTWIAVLGYRDEPTDGVDDYCTFLARALMPHGIELTKVRATLAEKGCIGALRQLSRDCAEWRGQWILLQYTAFMWSRHGFPLFALLVLTFLRRSVRVAVVFHEPCRQGGSRAIDRLRGVCQDWVIQQLYRRSEKSVFTVPIETIGWLPKDKRKAVFIPIGANIPECATPRSSQDHDSRAKTVIVFGVTEAPVAAREAAEIAAIMKELVEEFAKLRLIVVGRGSLDAEEILGKALKGSGVEVVVRGILPAEEIAREFQSADVQLCIRGPLTLRRGSALAGVACGVPVVGYRQGKIDGPLDQAGVEWSYWQDRKDLVRALGRVLRDPERWAELRMRSIQVQQDEFSWSRIAERYQSALA